MKSFDIVVVVRAQRLRGSIWTRIASPVPGDVVPVPLTASAAVLKAWFVTAE